MIMYMPTLTLNASNEEQVFNIPIYGLISLRDQKSMFGLSSCDRHQEPSTGAEFPIATFDPTTTFVLFVILFFTHFNTRSAIFTVYQPP